MCLLDYNGLGDPLEIQQPARFVTQGGLLIIVDFPDHSIKVKKKKGKTIKWQARARLINFVINLWKAVI